MAFNPYLDWVDVPNPSQPPVGAKMISASDLLRYEHGIEANEQDISTVTEALNTKADLVGGKVPVDQLPTDALVTDANVAAQIDGSQTGAAIDARINPVVEQVTADYIASQPAVVDAVAAAVDANPDISSIKSRLTVLDGQGQRGYTIDQTAGRTVKVWDYLNNREQMIHGDTGRRDITALFNGTAPNATVGIAGGTVYLTRVGRMVELVMESVTLPPGQSPSFVQLGDIIPAGFQPPNERDYPLGARLVAEGTSGGGIRINRLSGRIYVYLHADGETIRVTATWLTEDPWPAVLPGTAVGTIPHQ